MTQKSKAFKHAEEKSRTYTGQEIVVYQDFWSNFKVGFYDDFTDEKGDVVALFLDGKMIG